MWRELKVKGSGQPEEGLKVSQQMALKSWLAGRQAGQLEERIKLKSTIDLRELMTKRNKSGKGISDWLVVS